MNTKPKCQGAFQNVGPGHWLLIKLTTFDGEPMYLGVGGGACRSYARAAAFAPLGGPDTDKHALAEARRCIEENSLYVRIEKVHFSAKNGDPINEFVPYSEE